MRYLCLYMLILVRGRLYHLLELILLNNIKVWQIEITGLVNKMFGLFIHLKVSDHQGSNFESCVSRAVSSHSSRHPQDVVLAQLSLYVHKKPHSFYFSFLN